MLEFQGPPAHFAEFEAGNGYDHGVQAVPGGQGFVEGREGGFKVGGHFADVALAQGIELEGERAEGN